MSHPPKLSHFLLALAFLVFLISGIGGVDFGLHWDESTITAGITQAVQNKSVLPQSYYYSSFPHDMGLASLVPDLLHFAVNNHSLHGAQAHLLALTSGDNFLLRMRLLTILVTSLAILWVYWGVFLWRRNEFEAAFAAALVALSWEINYHSRWFSPDPIVMQFGALTLACALASLTSEKAERYLIGAAIGAGLGLGSKYPAGLLIIIPIAAALLKGKKFPFIAGLAVLAGLAFILTSPGFLIHLKTAAGQVVFNASHYYSMEHPGYNVARGFEHLSRMLIYLGLALFSKFAAIGIFFSLLSVVGVYAVVREKDRAMWFLLLFPALYLGYFSLQVVMIVRNILILAPFLAALAARGSSFIEARLLEKRRIAFYRAALVLCLVVNGAWELHAMQTVRHRDGINQTAELAHYIDQRPTKRFLVPKVFLPQLGDRANITADVGQPSDLAVFSTYDAKGRFDGRWPANRYGFVTKWFGPYEVNLDYYPSWWGNHRLVVMPTARAMQVLLPAQKPEKAEGLKKYVFPGYGP
jgi:hypothetical protein